MENRELGPMEKAMTILDRRACAFNVVTISRIKGPLSVEIVRQSLDQVLRRHSRLNSRIVGSLDSLRFEVGGTPCIPLRVVDRLHNQQWTDVVLEELNDKIEINKSLLRTVLIRPSGEKDAHYLITTVFHAISDGLSCLQLHSEILTYCQSLVTVGSLTQVNSLPALPPVEELLPKSTKKLSKQLNSHQSETLGFEKYVPMDLRRCGLIHRQLDTEFTQQLINTCRKEKTTVQGALCAAMLLTAANFLRAGKNTDVPVKCRSIVDLRRRLKPIVKAEHMVVTISSVMSFHTIKTDTSFWELARDVRQQLEAGLERDSIFSTVLMYNQSVASVLEQPHEVLATVCITNVGRVNIPRLYGPLELEEISCMPSIAAFGGVFYAAVTTFEGKLFWNFPFSEPAISRETMEVLVNSAVSCLIDACN